MSKVIDWVRPLAFGLALAAPLPSHSQDEGRAMGGNTPMVIEAGAEVPTLSEVPLPPAAFSKESAAANGRVARQRLESMLGDVESLTGIPESGLDLPLVFPDEALFPSR